MFDEVKAVAVQLQDRLNALPPSKLLGIVNDVSAATLQARNLLAMVEPGQVANITAKVNQASEDLAAAALKLNMAADQVLEVTAKFKAAAAAILK